MRFAFAIVAICFASKIVLGGNRPEEILAAARMNPMGAGIALEAQLRAGQVKVPFTIEVGEGAVRYGFIAPQQDILLRLGESESTLEERREGTKSTIPVSKFDDSVRGGLITYEDLALRFLYWKIPACLERKRSVRAMRGRSKFLRREAVRNTVSSASGSTRNPLPSCASKATTSLVVS
jgi:hypothetical protein